MSNNGTNLIAKIITHTKYWINWSIVINQKLAQIGLQWYTQSVLIMEIIQD